MCDACLKGDTLCQRCNRKLEEGKISQLDVEVSRALHQLAQKHHELEGIDFKRALKEGGLTALVVEREGTIPATKRRSELISELEKRLETRIRVIETDAGTRKIAQNILVPVKIRGVNVLFRKDGKEEHRVRIRRSDLMLLPASIDVLQALIAKITGKDIKLVFE